MLTPSNNKLDGSVALLNPMYNVREVKHDIRAII